MKQTGYDMYSDSIDKGNSEVLDLLFWNDVGN